MKKTEDIIKGVEQVIEEKEYVIPVTWQMYGIMRVNATSFEEAVEQVYGDAPPPDGSYVESSIEIDEEVLLEYVIPNQIVLKQISDDKVWYKAVPLSTIFNVLSLSDSEGGYLVGENKVIKYEDAEILN